jgi:hypothetical protein
MVFVGGVLCARAMVVHNMSETAIARITSRLHLQRQFQQPRAFRSAS